MLDPRLGQMLCTDMKYGVHQTVGVSQRCDEATHESKYPPAASSCRELQEEAQSLPVSPELPPAWDKLSQLPQIHQPLT
jgi:hypothetical protein